MILYTARLVLLTLVVSMLGCTTVPDSPGVPPVYIAAGADTVSTAVALSGYSGRELNPLGFWGTTVGKGIYLFYLRERMTEPDRVSGDRWASSIWGGAAVNNVIGILFPGAWFVSVGAGFGAGVLIFCSLSLEPSINTPTKDTKICR
jgi:hypothetical protein